MKIATASPYRRAAAHRLTAGRWELLSTDAAAPLPLALPSLDYGSILRLRREVIIDAAGIRADCGLASDAPLLAAASWSSPGTMLRRRLTSTPVSEEDGVCIVELTGAIAGTDILNRPGF